MSTESDARDISRRDFLVTSAGTLAAAGLVLPLIPPDAAQARAVARGAHAGGADTLRVGLVGCGGRGRGAATQAILADPGSVLWAVADAFAERINPALKSIDEALAEFEADDASKAGARARVKVGDDRKFVGLDSFAKLIPECDVVLLCSPPAFRPEQLRAAVDAGKHVFCEKPVAVDSTGVRSALESARIAREKKLSLVSGFCWRYADAERATYQRVHDGAIGDIRAVYTTYNAGGFPPPTPRKPEWTDVEFQLRNWHYFAHLSGDHIAEQACHSIDKIAWAMRDRPPATCVAVGGRQGRPNVPETGNIFDHFGVTYEYADGSRAFHMCRHFPNTPFDNSDYLMGSKGTCFVNGWGPKHVIEGEQPWKYEGPRRNMYQTEHDELFASIRAAKAHNDGEFMAHSTLMAIMARMAAYTGQAVTWEQALNSKEQLTPAVWRWGPFTPAPVPVPGVTKLV
ncbi:MAG: Gfo/Idh/MocA family oxidoreductase [Planctomycetota bacterium]|nr:Gfo/Idh/MocA family oxidoreductase [Planctomycetota bacterium]